MQILPAHMLSESPFAAARPRYTRPMATPGTETALIVEVPAAEPAVGHYRAELDANAGLGIPAHITILAPFLPAGRLGTADNRPGPAGR
jgi:hypothetical protein